MAAVAHWMDVVGDEMEYDRGCAGKERYPSVSAAEAAKRFIIAQGINVRQLRDVEPYRCHFCAQFHLGHDW